MTLLTIGIPTFNRARELEVQVERLAPYVVEGVRVLVLDNGSADATAAGIERLAARYPWFEGRSHKANLGCDANFLRLVELAETEWCWLVGDDENVQWRCLPELADRLRIETATAVHVVAPGITWPREARTRDLTVEDVLDAYQWIDLLHLSTNVFRVARAREHLRHGYRVAGLLHAYTAVLVRTIEEAPGLAVYPMPVLQLSTGSPRWPLLRAHIGAWRTARYAFGRERRATVDRLEARRRARDMARLGAQDLLGLGHGEMDRRVFAWFRELFPVRHWPKLLRLGVARATWAWPSAGAFVARWVARRAVRGRPVSEIASAIRERARKKPQAPSEY